MSTRAAIRSSAARQPALVKSRGRRDGGSAVAPRATVQLTPPRPAIAVSSTHATATSTPAMKTNGATAASTSIAFWLVLFASVPLVASDLAANRPASTVPIQPPPLDNAAAGCSVVSHATSGGP